MAAPRTARTTLALLLCSAALAGCGSSEPSPVVQGSAAPPPPGEIVVVNHGLDHPPPQDEAAILAPAELKADETTVVVESPPLQEGVPAPLVSETTTVVETTTVAESSRLAQLEKEVAALRADYNAMMPAFNGLITTNERIKTLLDQLEQKAGGAPAAPVAATEKPAEMPPAAVVSPTKAEPQAAATPAPTGDAVIVSGMRIGEHGDKTRLVLDATAAAEYKTEIINGEKKLLIAVPHVGWTGKDGVSGLKSPLVSGWSAMPGSTGGVVLTVALKTAVKVVGSEVLKADGNTPARIVIDIAADKPAS